MKRHGTVAHNTAWNLLGTALPMLAAVFTIPPLIHGLGNERFGVLTLAWTITGYFALFDFGLGRATTKFVAEYIARGALADLPRLFWSSLLAHALLGAAGGGLLALATPWLAGGAFAVSAELAPELRATFYLLALSVPLVVVTACLRGVLEAVQRFDVVNLIRIPAGIFNFVAPLLVVLFTNHLPAVVGIIVASRALVLLAHALACFRALPVGAGRFAFAAGLLRPLLGFGGWVTVSSLMVPLIVIIDRFVIAALVSVAAVAYYATPYEVITKLWIFSASLLGALFPVLSALAAGPGAEIRALAHRSSRYLVVMVAPCVAVLLSFADDLLAIWIGPEFAAASAPAARWLAVGVLINVAAQVPFTVLQGMGKAGLAARLQLVQLPPYALALWGLTLVFGVTGAAIAWTVRAAADFVLLTCAAERVMPRPDRGRLDLPVKQSAILCLALAAFWLIGSQVDGYALLFRVVVFAAAFALFLGWEWTSMLHDGDRTSLMRAARDLSPGRGTK